MKGFFKFLAAVAAVFAAVIGVLAAVDAFMNRNRLKGSYLDCPSSDDNGEQ